MKILLDRLVRLELNVPPPMIIPWIFELADVLEFAVKLILPETIIAPK